MRIAIGIPITGIAAPANAAVIFSNLGAGDSFRMTSGWVVGNRTTPFGSVTPEVAAAVTPTADAIFRGADFAAELLVKTKLLLYRSAASLRNPADAELLTAVRRTLIPLLICLLWLPAPAQVTQQGNKLTGIDAIGRAGQGSSVSLSADGNTAIVGGPHDSSDFGASWIFQRTGGVWSQQGNKVIGTGVSATNAPLQGSSVAISADGNTAIVGGIDDRAEYGSAWVYTQSNGVWAQQGPKLAEPSDQPGGAAGQGYSVALSADGNTALVGAVGLTDLCCNGVVFVYTRVGNLWSEQAVLAGDNAELLGSSVALSADGNTALAATLLGAAYVFARAGGTWTRQSKLAPGGGGIVNAVSLSADGNTALLGAPADNGRVGAAWVLTRTGSVWTTPGNQLVGAGAIGNSGQGFSVAISADGTTAIVGGPGDNDHAGAAWLFRWSGSGWTQIGNKLVGTGAVGNAGQGRSVAISADGSTAMVGGEDDNSGVGAVWIYTNRAIQVAQLISPANHSVLPGPSVPFSWTPVSGADQYWLDVGTAVGQGNICAGATTVTFATCSGVPTDGSTIFVQLWTHISGTWQTPVQYTYTASLTPRAQLTSPVAGTVLTSSVTFAWSSITGADQYWLDVGTSVGQGNICAGATTSTSATCSGIPMNGGTVYVQVWTHISGTWQTPNRYTFTALQVAHLTSPVDRSVLPGSSVLFTWSGVSGADQYWLDVGTSIGQGNICAGATGSTSSTCSGIPTSGTIYVQVWTHISGAWQIPVQYTFTGG